MTCTERIRAAQVVVRWCEEQRIHGDVAGQWLGRVTEQSTDWLVAIVGSAPFRVPDKTLEWIPLRALATSDAVVEYQQWALRTAVNGAAEPCVRGPFGNLSWPATVRAWITAATRCEPSAITPYRVSPHEVVLGVDCACGRVYFKGLVGERTVEPILTQALARIAPDSFAQTLACERREDGSVWWLMTACPGVPAEAEDAQRAARALATIQQQVIEAGIEAFPLPRIDFASAREWAITLLGPAASRLVTDACAHATSTELPHSWIPMDLDPTNVLIDEHGGVRFIDIDDSFVGPAPLAMASFAARCGDRAAYAIYEQAWAPSRERIDWQRLEVAAAVFQAWLGWNRLQRNVGHGDVHAALDRVEVHIRERLASSIYRR
jgi:hypothetical protein